MNARSISKVFLPLTVICAGVIVGELNASAKEAPTAAKTAKVAVVPQGAALLGDVSIDANRTAPLSQFSIAQSSPTNPSQITPGRSTPSQTPGGSTNNPADTTPSSGTRDNPTPGSTQNNAAPLTTPSNSQSSPTNPSQITPGRSTPSTTPGGSPNNPADTTTPGNTTPTSPQNTTPGTTTPGTTTPDTTTPGTTPAPTTTQELAPGRATRSGSSYFGVGGNIGIGDGDTALGQGSFALISKIGLTRNFSARPSILFTDDVTILVPITYDFSFGEGPTGGLGFTAAPYLGVGAAISTGRGGDVGLLLTGGIDVPVSSQFTATAAVNASVTGQAAVGILLGIGYNFAGF